MCSSLSFRRIRERNVLTHKLDISCFMVIILYSFFCVQEYCSWDILWIHHNRDQEKVVTGYCAKVWTPFQLSKKSKDLIDPLGLYLSHELPLGITILEQHKFYSKPLVNPQQPWA